MPPAPLPLPVARLHRRSFNAKSAKDRHDTAYFAWEVSVRLGVAAAPPANAGSLARASVGQWCRALEPKDRPLADGALLALHATLTETATGARSERTSITPRDLLDALPAYRNKVLGHGSARQPSFYEESGRALLAGLEAAWREHLFLPAGATLVHVDGVALDAAGGRVARAMDLSSETPVVLDGGTTHVPDAILPRRLYLRGAGTWRALHPWLLYDEEAERLWCFNGLGRRAEYLDYASGETLGGAALEKAFPGADAALRALIGASDAALESLPEAPIADERRFGDYEVLGKLGEGGMGAVYLAQQSSLGRTVALKMLPPERAKDAVAVGRFQREVRALARCEHPNVVKIYASGEARGTHYYAMEYVDGADLSKVAKALSSSPDFDTAVSSAFELARGERAELFPDVPAVPRRPTATAKGLDRWRQMARFFAQAARGLEHLHANGIVHRDISPGNIMVTWPDERAVIMDLGLAAVENASVTLTKDKSAILGTLRYIAPEQLQKHLVETDKRVDVYSFGATMYELFGGRPIFDGETEPRLIAQVLREEPKLLSKLEPRLPVELAHIVHKAVEKDPARRYATAADLAADLEAFLAGEPIQARAPTLGYRVRRWVRRRRELVLGGSAGLVLAVAVGVYLHRSQARPRLEARLESLGSTIQRLDRKAAELTPLEPEPIDAWLAEARQFVLGADEVEALRREFQADHADGRPVPREFEAEALADDTALETLAERERVLAQVESTLAARTGSGSAPSDLPAELPTTAEMLGWEPLNQEAWKLVGPYRSVTNQEAVGLALARRALESVPDEERWRVVDTIAWALFDLGRDEEALAEAATAQELAPNDQLLPLLESKERLDGAIATARSPEQTEILRFWRDWRRAAVEMDRAHRARLLEGRFADAQDRRIHTRLSRILRSIEVLRHPRFGKIAWIEEMQKRAVSVREAQANASTTWSATQREIQSSPLYTGLALEPIPGLQPLGPDPKSGLQEFAHLASGTAPVRDPANGALRLDAESGIVLVLLPGGSTRVGATLSDEGDERYDPDITVDEDAIHTVRLHAFLIGKHEVTQAQWYRMTREQPSGYAPGRCFGVRMGTWRNPVEKVSWADASSELEAVGLTLPTEAQWEYAARAGTESAWWSGDSVHSLEGVANYADHEFRTALNAGVPVDTDWSDGYASTAPIGSFRSNPFGLYDVAGNVWEWCLDLQAGPTEAPRGGDGLRVPVGSVKLHAMRGGAWDTEPSWLKSAARGFERLTTGQDRQISPTIGIRAARRLDAAAKVSQKTGPEGTR